MSADVRAYWIWLQNALGGGSGKLRRILSLCSSLQALYESGEQEWRLLGVFGDRELYSLRSFTVREAQHILEESERLGHQVLTPECEQYPRGLWEIANPPAVLYVKGTLPDFSAMPSIAVVGTRTATQSGRKIAFSLSYQLAQAGAVVVSGGARGVDTAAHKGALQAGGITLCVLGCGLEYPYLMENASLRESICTSGAVLSEYPLRTPGTKAAFPIRNRIISGLSSGVLVVEAAAKSGSLITANLALEQGRDVFAVPCGIDNPVSLGVNTLIKTGAVPVSCAADILEHYEHLYPQIPNGTSSPDKEFVAVPERVTAAKPVQGNKQSIVLSEENASPDALAVYRAMEEEVHLSVLAQQTGLSTARLLSALTELELTEAIQAIGAGRYRRMQ